jgi:hypothetical protein
MLISADTARAAETIPPAGQWAFQLDPSADIYEP